jgi:hypothetical protein
MLARLRSRFHRDGAVDGREDGVPICTELPALYLLHSLLYFFIPLGTGMWLR